MQGNLIERRKFYEAENMVSVYGDQENNKYVSSHDVTGNLTYAAHRYGCFLCCRKHGAQSVGSQGYNWGSRAGGRHPDPYGFSVCGKSGERVGSLSFCTDDGGRGLSGAGQGGDSCADRTAGADRTGHHGWAQSFCEHFFRKMRDWRLCSCGN